MPINMKLAEACIDTANAQDKKRWTLPEGDPLSATMKQQSDDLRLKAETLITKGVAGEIAEAKQVQEGVNAATKIAAAASSEISHAKDIVDLAGGLMSFTASVMSGNLPSACSQAKSLAGTVGKLL